MLSLLGQWLSLFPFRCVGPGGSTGVVVAWIYAYIPVVVVGGGVCCPFRGRYGWLCVFVCGLCVRVCLLMGMAGFLMGWGVDKWGSYQVN